MEWCEEEVERGGGERGEGLTAINFAKIGAYAVAGRQSNPSSAHYPPYAEMGVQLDVESSRYRSDALLVAISTKVPAYTFCNYLPGTQNSFSFSNRFCFPSFSPLAIFAEFDLLRLMIFK